jgi:hypothetical protein
MWKFLNDLFFTTSADSGPPPAPSESVQVNFVPVSGRGSAGEQAFNRRTRYIRSQAFQLAKRFSKNGGQGIQLDEDEYNWLIIPKYPMPGRWKKRWTKLMILFPTAYPDVPPTGFYLRIPGRLKSGGKDGHLYKGGGYYAEAPDLSEAGWYWYCVHAQVQVAGGWQPSSDPASGDNLFTFLNMAREALSTDA